MRGYPREGCGSQVAAGRRAQGGHGGTGRWGITCANCVGILRRQGKAARVGDRSPRALKARRRRFSFALVVVFLESFDRLLSVALAVLLCGSEKLSQNSELATRNLTGSCVCVSSLEA